MYPTLETRYSFLGYDPSMESFRKKIPILRVCLGHQSICEVFGGTVFYAKELMHGKKKTIFKTGESKLLKGLPDSFPAARYHSLAAIRDTLPDELISGKVTLKDAVLACVGACSSL